MVVPAQKQVRFDSSFIESRTFDNASLQELKKDKAFQYEKIQEPVKSLWERFWDWVWHWITRFLSTKEGKTTLNVLLIVFGVSMIIFFVVKVMGMNKNGFLGRSSKDTLDYTISADDIHSISFNEAIQDAIATSNYRLAIRLLYLQSLKKLSDKGFIDWKINKTNSDYLKETNDKQWAHLFKTLTYNFDYTWYGEMPVNKERFEAVHQQFQTFNNQL
jgi:hypothetical protein